MSSSASEEKDIDIFPGVEAPPHRLDLRVSGGDESLELTPQELRRLKRIVDWCILLYISLLFLLHHHVESVLFSCSDRLCWLPGFLDLVGFILVWKALLCMNVR